MPQSDGVVPRGGYDKVCFWEADSPNLSSEDEESVKLVLENIGGKIQRGKDRRKGGALHRRRGRLAGRTA